MSGSRRTVDARGLACPEPVILTRKALAQGGFDLLELIVDDGAARENVLRFATFAQAGIEAVTEDGPDTHILIRPSGAPVAEPESRLPEGRPTSATTVFIASEGIGRGDEQLAALLMRGFLYTLTESGEPPLRIILMNGGVKLAVEGSDSLVNLRRLADQGVEILACGTCLEFHGLKDALAVGRVSNMYELADLLQQGHTLTI